MFQIKKIKTKISAGILHKHIKGHQDTNVSFDKLSIKAQLNIDVDKLASQALKDAKVNPFVLFDPFLQVQLNLEGTFCSDFMSEVQSAYAFPQIQTYWSDKLSLSRKQMARIDFIPMKHNMLQHKKRHHFIIQFSNRQVTYKLSNA